LPVGKGDVDCHGRERGNFRGYSVLPGFQIGPLRTAIPIAYRVSNGNSGSIYERQPNAGYRATFRIDSVYRQIRQTRSS